MRIVAAMLGLAAIGLAAVPAVPAQAPAVPHVSGTIEDRALGTEWVMTADPEHPGGPGRLVQVPLRSRPQRAEGAGQGPVVIKAGERVRVEEHTAAADVLLEVLAMEPARAGEVFRVRMKLGGRVLRARAVEHGRAVLVNEVEKP